MGEAAAPAQRQATAAQLRRMAKARPYVPLHEVRRTYNLPGDEEVATRISTPSGDAWIGLPEREARLVEQLVREGELALVFDELPRARVVVGFHGLSLHA
ncbi:MAG: hypothetical protein RLZZ432_4 [Chloroflexota bacterium]|jgi:hypothetical protein